MNVAWQRYLDAAGGLTQLTRQSAETVVRTLVRQGEIAADRAERAVDDLLKRSDTNRKVLAAIVRTETERAVGRLGLASQRDLERLSERVARLEQAASQASAAGSEPESGEAPGSAAEQP